MGLKLCANRSINTANRKPAMGNVNRQVSLALALAVGIAGSFGCRAWADTGQVPKRDLSPGKTSVSARSGKVKGSEVKLQAQ